MNLLSLLAVSVSLSNPIHLLMMLAVLGILVWAAIAIFNQTGLTVHPIVRIVLIAVVSIVAIIVLFKLLASFLN